MWQVDRGRLASWTRGPRWPAQERLEARCPMRGRAPAAGHRCGIYAVRTRELAERLLADVRLPAPRPVVIGRVSLWGRVFENTHGWRAQFAYQERVLNRAGAEGYELAQVVIPKNPSESVFYFRRPAEKPNGSK